MSLDAYKNFELDLKFFRGFLANDPEVDYKENGKVLTKFSLPLKKKKDDDTVWLNCQAWGNLAEQIGDNYKKGNEVIISGYFTESEYKGKSYVTFNIVTIGRM